MSFFRSSPRRPESSEHLSPGVSRPPRGRTPLRLLEWLVLGHVGLFLLSITWGFGGAADWLRVPFGWFGSLGALLTLAALQDREARRDGRLRPLIWLWPLVAFNIFVLLGCLNPSFTIVRFGDETLLANSGGRAGWPSSAQPEDGLGALALFDVTWISCFNLALVIRQRWVLRALLIFAAGNALVLAVFGTVQKLSRAKGLFFDAVASPQKFFFSSFVYHNHWGAFVVLILAICLGLTWHYLRRSTAEDFFHSPAFMGVVAMFFLAASVPLSTSRSCTLLTVILLGAAFAHWFSRLVQKRRRLKESLVPPLAGALLVVALATAGVWQIAGESITLRFSKTREQLGEMNERGSIGSRALLYRDTWRMARDQPWFGWGMGSYPRVFTIYNSQRSVDKLPVYYRDAHSDWLQALAEHGPVGSTLLALCALVPLFRVRWRTLKTALPAYLLGGCTLLLLYAWVEFPFANLAVDLTWWLCFFCAVAYARLLDREARAAPKARPASAAPFATRV